MRRLRHLWGVARHRVPLQIHDRIQHLRLQKKLEVYAGRILNMVDGGDFVRIEIKDKNKSKILKMDVARVINCSGPESDISMMEEHTFLKNCLMSDLLRQDPLKLGIDTEWPGMRIFKANGNTHTNMYTLGSNLRGILWESTAVKELREQAAGLADILKEKIMQ